MFVSLCFVSNYADCMLSTDTYTQLDGGLAKPYLLCRLQLPSRSVWMARADQQIGVCTVQQVRNCAYILEPMLCRRADVCSRCETTAHIIGCDSRASRCVQRVRAELMLSVYEVIFAR